MSQSRYSIIGFSKDLLGRTLAAVGHFALVGFGPGDKVVASYAVPPKYGNIANFPWLFKQLMRAWWFKFIRSKDLNEKNKYRP